MPITVRTNNVPRDIVFGYEVPLSARKDFDYIDWDAEDNGAGGIFIQYRGSWYDLNDMERVSSVIPGNWDRMVSDTFFSGVLFRVSNDCETVVCGRYFA